MPSYVDVILDRMNSISSDLFGSYQPLELCNLEYSNDRLSAIEMHHDDTWIWGERLIWFVSSSKFIHMHVTAFLFIEVRMFLESFSKRRFFCQIVNYFLNVWL